MENKKQLGIWMDHSNAVLMELKNKIITTNNIESESTPQVKEKSFVVKGEKHMHVKEQHQQSSYYKKISDAIRNYHEVVIFGPTDAKVELFNLLKSDLLLADKKIEVKHSDKMTENQLHAYVREYFNG